ncbi:hypothetical protein ACP87_07715 [Pseudomonas oleovorans]|jgi:hypothetical protein|nr:hypothetical protein JF55_23450 [Pseudomonas sp. 1-7]MBN7117659.1 hypothetical protein [Pseudomonas oleovorans]MBN7133205.1 hypothetical protein [Pseudomonas oleovorans]MBN7140895.1 hypothetical protein [Pseudomonas oleovorans]
MLSRTGLDLIAWLPGEPGRDVVQCRAGDGIECFVGEKSLVRGDDDVGKAQQAGQSIVLQRQVGMILEEQFRLFFVDVQAQVAELAAFQRLDQCRRVDQRAAAGVEVSLAARNDTRS